MTAKLVEADAVEDSSKLPIHDPEIDGVFALDVEPDKQAVRIACKGLHCKALWRVPLEQGVIPVGWRTPILQHLEKHRPKVFGRLR